MSKHQKPRTRAAEQDATSRSSTPEGKESSLQPIAKRQRPNLLALLIAGALWFGWFVFLVYVAVSRS